MNQMYKAAVIDLDGTLLNDERKVGLKDLQTLQELENENIYRIVATGRSLFSINEVIPGDFPIDYLIFAAGAGIMNFRTKEIIKSHHLIAADVKNIANKLCELKIDFQIRAEIPESHKYVYKRFFYNNPDFDRLNNLYKDYSEKLSEGYKYGNATRFIAISPKSDIVNIISEEFSQFGIIRASSPIDNKSVWMEIYPQDVNKGSSLKYLCNGLNINLSETIGLGNDYNDIDFLKITGRSYVVENSPKILKKTYLNTVSNNENPLSEIVKDNFNL